MRALSDRGPQNTHSIAHFLPAELLLRLQSAVVREPVHQSATFDTCRETEPEYVVCDVAAAAARPSVDKEVDDADLTRDNEPLGRKTPLHNHVAMVSNVCSQSRQAQKGTLDRTVCARV